MLSLLIIDALFDIGTALPQARIVLEHRPSVIVVELPPNVYPQYVHGISGVQVVIFSADGTTLTTLGDPLAIDKLSSSEKLFVRGWGAAQISGPKARPGDKLPWDTPGFEPP